MTRIYLPGDPPATFADDHYRDDPTEEITVVAQVPDWADIRWYHDLVRRHHGREAKSGWVRANWDTFAPDLRRAADRCFREVLISIQDSTLQRLEVKATVENIMKRPLLSLPQDDRRRVEGLMNEQIDLQILLRSPSFSAMRFIEGEGLDLRRLRNKLKKTHNVRLFGARSAAALAEYLDADRRAAALEQLWDRRYFFADDLTGLYLADAVVPHRTFDQGNSLVFEIIREMRERVAKGIRARGLLILPPGAAQAAEADSKGIPRIAVADIAAGIAGSLYRSTDGLRKTLDRCKTVILNGAIIKR